MYLVLMYCKNCISFIHLFHSLFISARACDCEGDHMHTVELHNGYSYLMSLWAILYTDSAKFRRKKIFEGFQLDNLNLSYQILKVLHSINGCMMRQTDHPSISCSHRYFTCSIHCCYIPLYSIIQ